ncbi:MAG: hypothetical protein SVX43_08820 [Cyanobacteriota bacterium]|nr:hypothetical protein [Cyanobacteriota bacterium]
MTKLEIAANLAATLLVSLLVNLLASHCNSQIVIFVEIAANLAASGSIDYWVAKFK